MYVRNKIYLFVHLYAWLPQFWHFSKVYRQKLVFGGPLYQASLFKTKMKSFEIPILYHKCQKIIDIKFIGKWNNIPTLLCNFNFSPSKRVLLYIFNAKISKSFWITLDFFARRYSIVFIARACVRGFEVKKGVLLSN